MSSAPISQDQWDHMLEAWRIFDTDGDGLVTSADLQTVLLSFGYEHSIEELDEYLDKLPICVERDGSLDLPQFILWVKKLSERIDAEGREDVQAAEEALESRIPKQNSRKTMTMKEALANKRMNRETLEAMLAEEQVKHDMTLFKKVDVEDNGFITYQDVAQLAKELGEPLQFEDLDEMTFAICTSGSLRRVFFDKFVETLAEPVAWDEKDLLDCHVQLLEEQAEFREAELERMGVMVKKKKKDAGPPVERKGFCGIM